ncbi:MAG: prepilin-type N-terminal cleavage/methylation domain-containing protein [Planctomycetes bacterium]|nr:prepilin-type N-terminal cleavage/methylation domain-containing protein [Planctomycetota bacterium]
MKLSHTNLVSRRSGFTLLELLLASAIATLMLAGFYIVMNMTVMQTQASRDAVDAESTSRAVFNKISLDLSSVLGPGTPKCGGIPTTGATSSTTTTTATTTTAAVVTPSSVSLATDTQTDTSTDGSSTDGSQSTVVNIPFQAGVIGSTTQLTIFASRVPTILGTPGGLNQTQTAQASSDLVRIDYWFAASGGLCRQERPWVTADQTGNNADIDRANESMNLIAEEVSSVTFRYFDGSSWVDSWDTTSSTMPTPPVAVSITLTFTRTNPAGGDPLTKTVSQTIAVRTAPGTYPIELVDPVLSSGSTPTDSSSSSYSGGTTGGSK